MAVTYRRVKEKGQKGMKNLSFKIDSVHFYTELFIQDGTKDF